ncbi:MAG: NAD(P)-dependent oxidoreductase [Candidatus Omnitrophota bacterium]
MDREHILVTGATGFIGSAVVERLLIQGQSVVAIVRESENYKNVDSLKNSGVILCEGNFYEADVIEDIFEKFTFSSIIHCAALRGAGAGGPDDYNRVNVRGTQLLLEAADKHKVKKFVFCSSVGVFGTIPAVVPADINTPLNPDNLYHQSKVLAEQKVREYIERGRDAVIIRPTIVYGKGDNGFSKILVDLVRKKRLVLPFRDVKIHLLDVDKLAEVFNFFLTADIKKNNVFIIADRKSISLSRLADLIHFYFYKKKYPRILKIPGVCFDAANLIFKFIKNEKWSVRMQLLSKDWYYLPTQPDSGNSFDFSDTEKKFSAYLEAITDEK